jgi:hypothetical protein
VQCRPAAHCVLFAPQQALPSLPSVHFPGRPFAPPLAHIFEAQSASTWHASPFMPALHISR